jgi:hypothetical protein
LKTEIERLRRDLARARLIIDAQRRRDYAARSRRIISVELSLRADRYGI